MPDPPNRAAYFTHRRLGGESDREISMVPVCVILSLGFWSSISPPGLGVGVGVGRALGYGA
jgi:hypothetical protein